MVPTSLVPLVPQLVRAAADADDGNVQVLQHCAVIAPGVLVERCPVMHTLTSILPGSRSCQGGSAAAAER